MSTSLIRKGFLITLALAPVGLSEVKCRQESGTELLVSSHTFKNGSGCSTIPRLFSEAPRTKLHADHDWHVHDSRASVSVFYYFVAA